MKTKDKIRGFFCGQKKLIRDELNIPEYILWWALRILLICLIIKRSGAEDYSAMQIFQMSLNLGLTFFVPLMHIVFGGKTFLGRLPFRIQSYVDIIIFLAMALGHGFGLYWMFNDNYDKFIHIISGGVCIFIGDKLIDSFQDGDNIKPFIRCYAATGFSYIVMVLWEIFEFFADFYIAGSYNQNYIWDPNPNMLFFKIFGTGAGDTRQYPVFDTILDMFYAVIGGAVCGVILYAVLRHRQKKKLEAQINADEKTEITV